MLLGDMRIETEQISLSDYFSFIVFALIVLALFIAATITVIILVVRSTRRGRPH
jgi:hypothetical protein